MTSKFQGWTAHEIVGCLTKKEVRAALLDYEIERAHFRTWDTIEEMIYKCSDEIKEVLYRTGVAKGNIEEEHRAVMRKRKREEVERRRNVRRRTGELG
jgi:hypothetical protein